MKILLKCCSKAWEKAHLALGWSREVAAFLKAARDSIFYSDHLHTSFPSAVEQNFDIGSELGDLTRYFWPLPSGGQNQPNPLKSYCMDQPVISMDFIGISMDFIGISLVRAPGWAVRYPSELLSVRKTSRTLAEWSERSMGRQSLQKSRFLSDFPKKLT